MVVVDTSKTEITGQNNKLQIKLDEQFLQILDNVFFLSQNQTLVTELFSGP